MKQSEQVCSSAEHIENNITVGSLIIHKQTTWDDLSKVVTVTLKNHYKTVMRGWELPEASTLLNNTECSFISSDISAVEIGMCSSAPPEKLPPFHRNSKLTYY